MVGGSQAVGYFLDRDSFWLAVSGLLEALVRVHRLIVLTIFSKIFLMNALFCALFCATMLV